jgi:hypothetical protein
MIMAASLPRWAGVHISVDGKAGTSARFIARANKLEDRHHAAGKNAADADYRAVTS